MTNIDQVEGCDLRKAGFGPFGKARLTLLAILLFAGLVLAACGFPAAPAGTTPERVVALLAQRNGPWG